MSDKIILLNSNDLVDNNPKLLKPDNVSYGELGINYHKDVETVSTKNDADEIAEFVPYTIYEDQINNINNETFYQTEEPSGKTGDLWVYKEPEIPLTLEYNFSVNDLHYTAPIYGVDSCEIDWGDGQRTTTTADAPSHTYDKDGTYIVKIYGGFKKLKRSTSPNFFDRTLIKIITWGNSNKILEDVSRAFNYCPNLEEIPNDDYGFFSNIVNFDEVFSDCHNIGNIPNKLLQYGNKIETFEATFHSCTKISELPEDLFSNCKNAKVFKYTFRNCTFQNIPTNLFKMCINLKECYETFATNHSLIEIPDNLFKYNTAVTLMEYTFKECSALKTIPENLLRSCANLESVSYMFDNCEGLESIPENLFKYNTELVNCLMTFKLCNNLKFIPNNLFDNNHKITNFDSTFYKCTGLTGTTPKGRDNVELWERAGKPGYPLTVSGNNCFYDCFGLDNMIDIDIKWINIVF